MEIIALRQGSADFPKRLSHISGPPKILYTLGAPLGDLLKHPCVAVVGSRTISPYGAQVTFDLARQLAEQGVVIISGLALGVDAEAHTAALEAGGLTIAVLPTPVNDVYPSNNRQLAQRILDNGGALVSEYEVNEYAFKTNFVARNRIVSGLADALLITEAAEKSGSLHTARFALEQGKPVLVVPGPITSSGSVGTNNLLKSGATPVTSVSDVLYVLNLTPHQTKVRHVRGRSRNEQLILDLLIQGMRDGDDLLQSSQLSISDFNQVLTMLEISSKIRALGANQWAIW
jgi:DNA processing protein